MSVLSRLTGRKRRNDDDPPVRDSGRGGAGQLAATRSGGPVVAQGQPPQRRGTHPLIAAMAEGGIGPYRAKFEEFLPQHEELSQRRHSPFATLIIYMIGGFVVLTVLWMALSSLDSVATAQGVIRPAGKVKLVNHPEGGRVTRLLVTEGSEV